jgi:hypothetical protein
MRLRRGYLGLSSCSVMLASRIVTYGLLDRAPG